MLLKRLKATNSRGSELSLPLEDISGGFIVKEIEGLGPVKATLVSSSFANMDGEQYHSSRREARNILIKLGLDPDYGTQSTHNLRQELYDFFMPKTEVKLEFRLFNKFATNLFEQVLDVEIMGRIESCEPAIFSKDPAVDLSIMCYNPDFVDPESVIFEGSTVNNLEESILHYEGSVETGVVFTLLPNRPIDDVTIYYQTPDQKLHTVYFEHPMDDGDKLVISSVKGSKYVLLIQDGVERRLLYGLSPQSAWFELFPGDNTFRVYVEGNPLPFTIEYKNKYGGL